MSEATDVMAGLAANKSFLVDFICDDVRRSASTYQQSNTYTDHTILLHTATNYHLRANIWLPQGSYGSSVALANEIHAYNLAHNHNFYFLTVGYHGPGYKTLIASHDPKKIIGNPIGQKANLQGHREVQLSRGRVIIFDAHTDVHSQKPPESLSISLNLMPNQKFVSRTEQFEYDLDADMVIGYIRGHVTNRGTLIKLLSSLGVKSYTRELKNLALSFPCARTRLLCLQQLHYMEAFDDEILDASLRDPAELVHEWVVSNLV